MEYLHSASGRSFCEWKGVASYYDIELSGMIHRGVAWTYHNPTDRFTGLKDYIAFYAPAMDACYVGEEKVIPQSGRFYGGWITSDLSGPFKGEPGSEGW